MLKLVDDDFPVAIYVYGNMASFVTSPIVISRSQSSTEEDSDV